MLVTVPCSPSIHHCSDQDNFTAKPTTYLETALTARDCICCRSPHVPSHALSHDQAMVQHGCASVGHRDPGTPLTCWRPTVLDFAAKPHPRPAQPSSTEVSWNCSPQLGVDPMGTDVETKLASTNKTDPDEITRRGRSRSASRGTSAGLSDLDIADYCARSGARLDQPRRRL